MNYAWSHDLNFYKNSVISIRIKLISNIYFFVQIQNECVNKYTSIILYKSAVIKKYFLHNFKINFLVR